MFHDTIKNYAKSSLCKLSVNFSKKLCPLSCEYQPGYVSCCGKGLHWVSLAISSWPFQDFVQLVNCQSLQLSTPCLWESAVTYRSVTSSLQISTGYSTLVRCTSVTGIGLISPSLKVVVNTRPSPESVTLTTIAERTENVWSNHKETNFLNVNSTKHIARTDLGVQLACDNKER